MEVWTHHRHTFPLPDGHKFPLGKYERLAARMRAAGHTVHEAPAISWEALARVHDGALLERIRTGALSVREERGLGLPWSPELIERARRSVGGTVRAAQAALHDGLGMNLGGGTHHAGRDFARGYCLFNDVAVAVRELAPGRAAVVDCDVHQGDGTAHVFAGEPAVFTLSLHGARNYPFQRIPSDLDVDLPTGTGDDGYLAALDAALREVEAFAPELVFFLAGADPWKGDRLGRLSLSKAGLRARDELVLDRMRGAGAAVCVVLAGGYAPDIEDTVEINFSTAMSVDSRLAGGVASVHGR